MFPNINWAQLADVNYWLEGLQTKQGSVLTATPISKDDPIFWWIISFFFGLITLALLLRILQLFLHTKHPLHTRIPFWSNNFLWMGIVGFGWFLARELSVAFFGARIWLWIGIIWSAAIVGFIINYFARFWKLEMNYFNKVSLSEKSAR
jgi:hypothetical protein